VSADVFLKVDMIQLSKILFYTSVIIWLIPPIRQFKGSYFYYFLFIALMDPISIFLHQVHALPFTDLVYLAGSLLALYSLFPKAFIKKYFPILLIFMLLILFLFSQKFIFAFSQNSILLFTEQKQGDHIAFPLLMILLHMSILMIFIQRFILRYTANKRFTLFLLILIFYELTSILKIFNVMLGLADAVAFFVITTIAQSLFGLYFSIVREN
jgi:hypothetical protein